jgi:hypothetical protein
MRRKWLWIAPLAILGMVLFVAVGGWVVQALWNWLLPPLAGWPQITFWQALGLLVLCRVLFGGFGRHGSGRSRIRRRIEERSAERRELCRQRMADFGGFAPAGSETKAE